MELFEPLVLETEVPADCTVWQNVRDETGSLLILYCVIVCTLLGCPGARRSLVKSSTAVLTYSTLPDHESRA